MFNAGLMEGRWKGRGRVPAVPQFSGGLGIEIALKNKEVIGGMDDFYSSLV